MKRVSIGATVLVRQGDDVFLFGTREVRAGGTLPIRTESYAVDATVIRRGTAEPIGEHQT